MITNLNNLIKDIEVSNLPKTKIEISGITNDSRKVKPGSVFIAISGYQNDGKKFIDEAVNKGASVIIADQENQKIKIPVIEVKNIRKAMSKISANYYDNPSKKMCVIGITGTNGKTTSSFILNSIINSSNNKSALVGTLGVLNDEKIINTNLTTPDSIELQNILNKFVKDKIKFSILEVSSHALSLNRVDDIEFDMGVFTNISHDHLDFHGNMKNYINSKSKLFSKLKNNGFSIINKDDKEWKTIERCTNSKVITFSVNNSADIKFVDWEMSLDGIKGIVKTNNDIINVDSSLTGYFNLENILTAIACATSLNIPKKSIEKGIKKLVKIPGRAEKIKLNNGSMVIIDYAHTPDAYKKLFMSIKEMISNNSRLGVLFGCGGGRDVEKRSIMASYVEEFSDMIFVTPDNPRFESQSKINENIKSGFKKNNHIFFDDRKIGIHEAINWLKPNDILLIIGKGTENYQIVRNEKKYHSDLDSVNEFIFKGIKNEN